VVQLTGLQMLSLYNECPHFHLQAYWATLVSAVELKTDLKSTSQYNEALGQVSYKFEAYTEVPTKDYEYA
jgi:hypothetical protein